MKNIKIIIASIFAIALVSVVQAQEKDGGNAAVQEAQSTPPKVDKKFKNASKVLKEVAKSKKWSEGWDDKSKRIIAIESADFKTKDPATDEAFFVKREMAAKKAVLMAKASIIAYINQDMSATDLVDMPGTDVYKELNAEKVAITKKLEVQQKELVKMLEQFDKAEADKLKGVTFLDRLDDFTVAVIKKLDAEFDKEATDKALKEKYDAAKKDLDKVQKEYDELLAKAEALQEQVREKQESSVESMARMPLYGACVIMQTESWDNSTGIYQVAVLTCWSNALERATRAIVTGEEFTLPANPNGKDIQDWIETQNPAVMVGPRQFIDKDGNRWFLGISARAYDDEMTSTERRKSKGITEMFAQQMATFCLWADVESYKMAKSAMETRGDKKAEKNVVAESYSEKLSQSFQNKKVRGMQRLFSEEVVHPITGTQILVSIYGINSKSAKVALEIEKRNYATAVLENRHQTVERGRDAANKAAVEASKNRPEDFEKGFSEQSAKIKSITDPQKKENNGINIINKQSPKKAEANKASTSGTFGGDTNISDDF